MAELALGGIELAIRQRVRPGECAHETVISVSTAGIQRCICETCGHISVSFEPVVSGPATRGHFARPADETFSPTEPVESPFADVERLGVRRRGHSDPLELIA